MRISYAPEISCSDIASLLGRNAGSRDRDLLSDTQRIIRRSAGSVRISKSTSHRIVSFGICCSDLFKRRVRRERYFHNWCLLPHILDVSFDRSWKVLN
jgi:hypothetical protein